jgi:hypothetical protein
MNLLDNFKTKFDTAKVSRKIVDLELTKEIVSIADVVKEDVQKKIDCKMYSVISACKTKVKNKDISKKLNYKGI